MSIHFMVSYGSPDGLVVTALRCGRSNPGSNTGLDINFLLNRFLEEEAHKQTIGKQLKLLKSMKKYPNKKQYNLIVEKLYHVVEQMLSKPLPETFLRT